MKIKLTKTEPAGYKTKAVYEWQNNTIYGDDACLGGGELYWYCEPLFKGRMFRTLKGIKKAIELHLEGKLTSQELEWCEEM